MSRLLSIPRAGEWWEHKLAPIVGTGYATAVVVHERPLALAPQLALLIVAVSLAATFASVLNDLTDRAVDRRAGKLNRLEGWSRSWCAAALAAPVAGGAILAIAAYRHDPRSLALFAGIYVAFALYSAPGPRLKCRGAAGMLADAAGAHLLPTLLAAFTVFHASARQVDPAWMAAAGCWALALGIRGAIWHQLSDLRADSRTGVRTFALRRRRTARLIGGYVAFPSELLAFGMMLILTRAVLAAALIPAYFVLERRRTRRWAASLVVVVPAERYRIVMHEYYVALYPVAFLATAALGDPTQVIVLAAHALLFPRTLSRLVGDLVEECQRLLPRLSVRVG